ncbi:MAG: DUF423 domain-containing protein [Flavobacteriaceae bacterium]|nr:DUF423 domain-containing protein [Flavobacteriaceae bacterium]
MMSLQTKMRLYGSVFMAISILLGAFASHYLKTILESDSLASFQVGVRYLVYHGLALLTLSNFTFNSIKRQKQIVNILVFGCILFSGSIFILSFKEQFPFSVSGLGPITPIGGSLLILGWVLLTFQLIKKKDK